MLGSTIYSLRKRKGYTLSELADRAKISKSYLSNIERNINKNPSIKVMEKIAGVLDVELEFLIKSESVIEGRESLDPEWFAFVKDLKDSGVEKEQIHEYKALIEFIKWKNENMGDSGKE